MGRAQARVYAYLDQAHADGNLRQAFETVHLQKAAEVSRSSAIRHKQAWAMEKLDKAPEPSPEPLKEPEPTPAQPPSETEPESGPVLEHTTPHPQVDPEPVTCGHCAGVLDPIAKPKHCPGCGAKLLWPEGA